jgi:branched-chain amino acid transport system ATP-binding protein
MPLLSVSALEAGYGGAPVLHGVDLSVDEGEIVAVLGPNGAGKTTTLRAITALIAATGGSVQFQGEEIVGRTAEDIVALGIAHVPEGRGVFPALSVQDNLRLGGYLVARTPDRFRENLERVYAYFPVLLDRAGQLAGTLSGGEQQMLAIGRGLMSSPKLILVDEASLGLAPIIVKRVFAIVREINAAGTTVLMVEQNASFTLAIADRAFVMQKGQMVFSGTGEQLRAEGVAHAYLGTAPPKPGRKGKRRTSGRSASR